MGATRYSGIGGQAVLEGVMMKNQDKYAIAVRKPDHEIVVDVKTCGSSATRQMIDKIPFVRGIVNFVDALKLGMGSLAFSASFFDDEEEGNVEAGKNGAQDGKAGTTEAKQGEAGKTEAKQGEAGTTEAKQSEAGKTEAKQGTAGKSEAERLKMERKEKATMAATIVLAIVLAVALFMLAPYAISLLFQRWIGSGPLLALVEGLIRVAIFLGYIAAIARMEDIHRVFMYHGAEHKCINCVEHGLALNVENVKKSSRFHKRCGTSFLFLVVFISIAFFACIRTESLFWRFALRILFVPLIAGVAYEFLRLSGRSDNALVNLLSMPGLALQRMTTKEPDEDMIEVAIASVEAVFDWRSYINEIS